MESYLRDIRHTVRQLARNPGFTAAAVITLALGIGANTSLFSLANAFRLVAERFDRPDGLVVLWTSEDRFDEISNTALDVLDWRAAAESFEEMSVFVSSNRTLTGEGEPETVRIVRASTDLFPMLGLEPQIGRLPSVNEGEPGAEPVAVLSDRLWQRKFGGREDVLGETVELNDVHHTVIGVLPPYLEFDMLWRDARIFTPLVLDPARLNRQDYGYWSIARLKPGVSVEQSQAEMSGIVAGLADAYPETNATRTVRVEPLREFFMSTDDKIAVGAMLVAAAGVLMIACVNLANLMLARASSRGAEIAVRSALGAGRGRIVRQLLTESLLLALLGGAVGLAVSQWVVDLYNSSYELMTFAPDEIGANPAVLTYTFFIAVGSALVFGLTPGLAASRAPLAEVLKGGGASPGRARTRFRNAIVVGQLALTLPLLITCAMAMRQVVFLESLDFGFDTENLLTMQVDVPAHRYQEPEQWQAFYRDALEAVEAVPGVEAAGAALSFPIGAGRISLYGGKLSVEGRIGEEARPGDVYGFDVVTDGYFRTMGASLVNGRFFTDRDRADSQPVAIVNESMANHYWPEEDAVGRRFTFDHTASPVEWITVVGVVTDFGADFYGEPPGTVLYLPHSQRPHPGMLVVARTAGEPMDTIPALRGAIHGIDSGVPLYRFRTVDDHVDVWLNETRVISAMIGGVGFLALGLASIGLFGMISYSVVHRTREIGVRMALGAHSSTIMKLVIRHSLRLAAIGIVIGLVLSLIAGIALLSTLYGVEPPRVTTVLAVLVLLLAVVLLAAYLPARRAARIDPLIALRAE